MVRWARFVITHRKRVLLAWLAVVLIAGVAQSGLSHLLSDRFALPGAEAEKGFELLRDHFGEQGLGYTLVVVKKPGVSDAAIRRATQFAADRGAKVVKGTAGDVRADRC